MSPVLSALPNLWYEDDMHFLFSELPPWPASVPITPDLRPAFDALRHDGDLYSEWHFSSAWCWNVDDSATVSRSGSLVVLEMPSQDDGRRTVTVNGADADPASFSAVLRRTGRLDNVPWPLAKRVAAAPGFTVIRDDRSFDYVYDIGEQLTLPGRKFGAARNYLHVFARQHPTARSVVLDLGDADTRASILAVYDEWVARRTGVWHTERRALVRALGDHDVPDLRAVGIAEDGVLLGFVIIHVDPPWALAHFLKVGPRDSGVYAATWRAMFELASRHGAALLNAEQDAGLPGLRRAKRNQRPRRLLEKAVILPDATGP